MLVCLSLLFSDVEANTFGEFFNECDPVFTEFVGLPIEKQRDMLRKWLKFFQKTLPKKVVKCASFMMFGKLECESS